MTGIQKADFLRPSWLSPAIGSFGVLLGGLSLLGGLGISTPLLFDIASFSGGCGTAVFCSIQLLHLSSFLFAGLALAALTLCRWTNFWPKACRWLALLTFAFTGGPLAIFYLLPLVVAWWLGIL